MLEIEIDGKQLQVSDGSTVMEAASKVGAYVPHFCYHKKLSIAANCRMCLVQVEKAPKPLPACATPVTNGMKVWTHSEQAIKAQKGVMEFLLINHPLDCPICDQGGECQLQDLSVGYGGVKSRYEEEKRVVSNKDLGPLVSTDMTRCINCTRCVRFTTEIAGMMELGQAFRGEHAEIMPFVEKTLESELSGNIIDLCPVGALTSKPFRFGARAWELSRRKSISPHDSLGSNLIVQVKHDQVKRVLPLENEAINECWLSDKDRFSYEALNGEDRLLRPMVKQGGEWIETSWDKAIEYVVNGLRSISSEHGPDSIGALASPHSTVEELYLLQRFVRGLGSGNVDFRLRQSDFRADGLMSGAPWLGMPISDVSKLDRLLIIGSFLKKDHPLIAQRLRQATKKGLKISAVCSAFDEWNLGIAHRVAIAPSLISITLARIAGHLAAITDQTIDIQVQNALADVFLDDQSKSIAESLASGRKVAVWIGNHAQQSEGASQIQYLSQEIARLCKGLFGIIGEAANSVGGYVAGAVPFLAPFGKNAQGMVSDPLKAYLVYGADPGRDMADPAASLKALKAADTVVVFSAFKSAEALDFADVLLPITPFTETPGSFISTEGRVQQFYPVVKPAGDSRPGWKLLRVLGASAGMSDFHFEDIDEVRLEVFGSKIPNVAPLLGNGIEGLALNIKAAGNAIERVSDIPIYVADPIVRRSHPLQAVQDTDDGVARMNEALMNTLSVGKDDLVRISQGSSSATFAVVQDEGVADNCVRIAGATSSAQALEGLCGEIRVERVQ